jgi:cyclophilin family peptidyl-prolyl cis-trans isomerase
VNRSLANVEENLKFLKERKGAKASEPLLNSHPNHAAKIAGHPLRGGPVKEKHPMAVLKIKGKPDEVRIELYEDEAPNAVAAFISLAEAKKFDGLTFARIGEGERLRLKPKDEEAWKDRLAFEPTVRDAGKGSLVLAREGGHNQTEFEILLKPAANSREMTIFGRVHAESGPAGAQLLQNLEEKDEIESIKIESKRSHDYKPEYLK